MSRREWSILAAALSLMALALAFLFYWGSIQRLGQPGVRVVPEAMPGRGTGPRGDQDRFVAGTNSLYLPPRVLAYQSEVEPIQRSVWEILPKDTTFGQRRYGAADGFGLLNFAVLMGRDRTSLHKPQYCITGSGWVIASTERTTVRIPRPHAYDLPVMKLVTRGRFRDAQGRDRDLSGVLVYWFVADGQLTAEHGQRMWWMARDLVFKGVLQRWAYVVCFAPCPPGAEEATFGRLAEFLAASVPEYQLTAGAPAAPGLPR